MLRNMCNFSAFRTKEFPSNLKNCQRPFLVGCIDMLQFAFNRVLIFEAESGCMYLRPDRVTPISHISSGSHAWG
jgi:hypothetical protein